MLPRFLKVESVLDRTFKDLVFRISHTGDPIFGEIKGTVIHEGRGTYQKEGTKTRAFKMKQFAGVTEIRREDLKSFGVKEFVDAAKKIGGEFLKQKSQHFFGVINQATEESGNVVDGRGRPFSHELILEVLEKMQIDFDEDGNPEMPTMVVSPTLRPRVQQLIAEQDDPKIAAQFDAIIARKREEFRAREADRRLDG